MNQKKILENQKKLIRRVSELRQNTLKKRDKRDAIIDESLKSIESNQKELNNAKKNNQITDEHYAGATFLNSVSKAINEDIGAADNDTLTKINENLVAIRKQISDYTKASIDKQNTKISYTDPKRVSEVKAKKSKGGKGDKKKKGLFGWLAGLLGLAFLPFLSILKTIFKVGSTIFKGGAKLIKGLILGVGWLAKNVAFLARLSKGMILGVVELFTHPGRFLNNYLLNPIKTLVRGIVGNILSKIPLLKDTKFVKDFVKGTQAAKAANKAAKEAAKAEKIKKATDAVKSGATKVKDLAVKSAKTVGATLSGLAGKLWDAIYSKAPGFIQKGMDWFGERAKKFVEKIAKFAGEAQKLLKTALGKMWTIVKSPQAAKIIGKGVARVSTALVSLGIPGPGWILSAVLIGWMAVDMIKYLWDYRDTLTESVSGGAKVLIGALIYGFIGWDILGKDNEEWESLEVSSEEEAKRISSMSKEDFTKKTSEEIARSYTPGIAANKERIKTLENKTVLYKDANGNVLSLDESQKIQALELERERLALKQKQSDIEYKKRLESENWLDGEVELTPQNSKKLVDYMYEKLKNDSFYDHAFWGDMDIKKNTEMAKKYLESADTAWKEGDLRLYADQMARAEIYAKMIELYNSGIRNETEAQKILRSEKRFETYADKRNQTTKEINDLSSKLKGYSEHSIQSKDYRANFTLPNSGNSLEFQQLASAGAASTPRAAAAAAFSVAKYGNKSMGGWCARGVREALQGAGYNYEAVPSAYMAGPNLMAAGFRPLTTGESLHPKIGDVAVIDKGGLRNDGKRSLHGHMAIMTQRGWISDGVQKSLNVYRDTPAATIYRDTGNFSTFGDSKLDTITPSYATTNKTLNTAGLYNTPKPAPTVISQTTPQVPKEIPSTIDLTEYWELQV